MHCFRLPQVAVFWYFQDLSILAYLTVLILAVSPPCHGVVDV